MVQMQETRLGAGGDPDGSAMARVMNVTGALASLALIGGIGVWGYETIMRDVSGIPVVQALDGPMRETPDTPGGRTASNQGLSVNEVAARGAAAPPADRLIIAPPPLDLDAEDSAGAEAATDADGADGSEARLAVAGDGDGLARSLRPRPRPDTLDPVAFAIASVSRASVTEIDPASLPAGTHLAQIGAFGSDELARSEWARLSGRLGDLLEGKDRVVQKAESGARTFYRLRAAGFADRADTRRFCSALQAEGTDCIPVVTR